MNGLSVMESREAAFLPNGDDGSRVAFRKWAAPYAMLEFFAGSGLVSCGLQGMFDSVWANDIFEKKAAVYRANSGEDRFVLEDICNVSGRNLPAAHLSWASFPCQDLSLAGLSGGIHASRSGLVWEWLRVMREMPVRPKLLVAENVVGLVSRNNGADYRQLHEALTREGYRVGAVMLDASLFVPQSRPRIFVIAVDRSVIIPGELIDTGPNWLHTTAVRRAAEGLPGWVWWKAPHPPKRSVTLESILENAPFDKAVVEKNMALLSSKHKALLDAADSVVACGYRRTRHGQQVLELRFDGLAGCLRTPEGGSSRQFVVIKKNGEPALRLLSAREAARLMGAPDNFVLPERYNDAYKAMGDAVAAPVARFLGENFLMRLSEAAYNEHAGTVATA